MTAGTAGAAAPAAPAAHRVFLVREWDAQTSGSGCCGRLGGAHCDVGDPDAFAHNRVVMERMGAVYLALRAALADDVEITVVDPRNMVWLVPAILRDGRRRGLPLRRRVREVRRGVAQGAVVVDGLTVFSGQVPEPAAAVAAVRAELAAR